MVTCQSCGTGLEHVLGLVKDGTVYEAYRCASGHHVVVDTMRRDLPVQLSMAEGVCFARVRCGNNCYIFDRRIFRAALRKVLSEVRSRPTDLVLDLSEVGLVGEALLSVLKFLDSGLRKRGHRLWVITPSAMVGAEVRRAAPELGPRILPRERDALAVCGAGTGAAVTFGG